MQGNTSSARKPTTAALSSGEAELRIISGFIEFLLAKHLLEEMGHSVKAEVRTASQVAGAASLSRGRDDESCTINAKTP